MARGMMAYIKNYRKVSHILQKHVYEKNWCGRKHQSKDQRKYTQHHCLPRLMKVLGVVGIDHNSFCISRLQFICVGVYLVAQFNYLSLILYHIHRAVASALLVAEMGLYIDTHRIDGICTPLPLENGDLKCVYKHPYSDKEENQQYAAGQQIYQLVYLLLIAELVDQGSCYRTYTDQGKQQHDGVKFFLFYFRNNDEYAEYKEILPEYPHRQGLQSVAVAIYQPYDGCNKPYYKYYSDSHSAT